MKAKRKDPARFCNAWVKRRDAIGTYGGECFNRALKGSLRCHIHQVARPAGRKRRGKKS